MDDTQTAEQPQDQSQLSFGDVYNIYKDAQKSILFFKGMTMPQFSQHMIQHGSQEFAPGLEDSRIKRGSAAVDRFVKPLSQFTGEVGAQAGQLVGPKSEAWGRQFGESLPRSLAEGASEFAGAGLMLAPEPTGLTKLAGAGLLGLGAGSSGAETYGENRFAGVGWRVGVGWGGYAVCGARWDEGVATKAAAEFAVV